MDNTPNDANREAAAWNEVEWRGEMSQGDARMQGESRPVPIVSVDVGAGQQPARAAREPASPAFKTSSKLKIDGPSPVTAALRSIVSGPDAAAPAADEREARRMREAAAPKPKPRPPVDPAFVASNKLQHTQAVATPPPRPSPSAGSQPAVEIYSPPPRRDPVLAAAAVAAAAASPDLSGLDADGLCTHLMRHPELPSGALSAVCARIEALTSLKPPAKLAQRRVWIQDWLVNNAPPGAAALAQQRPGGSALAPGSPVVRSPPKPPQAASAAAFSGAGEVASQPPQDFQAAATEAYRAVAAPSTGGGNGMGGGGFATPEVEGRHARPSTGQPGGHTPRSPAAPTDEEVELLARIVAMRDAESGRLVIPPDQVPILTSAVMSAMGKLKSPPGVAARRRLIEDWYVAACDRLERYERGESEPMRVITPRGSSGGGDGRGASDAIYGVGPPPPFPLSPRGKSSGGGEGRGASTALYGSAHPHPASRATGGGGGFDMLATTPPNAILSGAPPVAVDCWQRPDSAPAQPAPPQPAPPIAAPPAAESSSRAPSDPGGLLLTPALFSKLASLDAGPLPLSVPSIPPTSLPEVARSIYAATGVPPAGSTQPDLLCYVSDWYRWEAHKRRVAAAADPTRAGRPPPSRFGDQLAAAAASDAAAEAAAEASAARAAPPPTAPPPTAPPHLPLPLRSVPTHEERTPGSGSVGGPPGQSFAYGQQRPSTAPSSGRSTLSLAATDEELSEAQLLAELATCISAPPSAVLASGPFDSIHMEIDNGRMAVIANAIGRLSGKKVPKLTKQRRDFIVAWWRLALARAAHQQALLAPTPPSPPSSRLDALREHELSPPTHRVALQKLLGEFGAPTLGPEAEELPVPMELLPAVCEQAEELTGQTAPPQPRARREWLARLAVRMRD